MNEIAFSELMEAAFTALPSNFREACDGLAIRVKDFPTDDVMAALQLSDPYQLLGLYHGINLARKSSSDLPSLPDTVYLYRLPILAYAEVTGHPVSTVIEHVLTHEIGHHFGLSDADMEAIEAASG